ncbi:MAG: hypothetical protein RLO18_01340, partial [Gimesia chilikensis]
ANLLTTGEKTLFLADRLLSQKAGLLRDWGVKFTKAIVSTDTCCRRRYGHRFAALGTFCSAASFVI